MTLSTMFYVDSFYHRDRFTTEQMSVLDWNDTMVYSSCIMYTSSDLFFFYFNHEDFTKLTMFEYPLGVS